MRSGDRILLGIILLTIGLWILDPNVGILRTIAGTTTIYTSSLVLRHG